MADNFPQQNVEISDFCRRIPKIELHAHLNGSISCKTLDDLRRKREKTKEDDENTPNVLQWQGCTNFNKENFSKGFQIFKVIHELVDNKEAVKQVTQDVIKEFSEDNVKYLELRSTPKSYPGMTKHCYLKEIISAIKDAETTVPGIIVRFLVSVDRKRGAEEAMENVQLAYDYQKTTNGIVCGVDLSGDPSSNPASIFIPAMMKAKDYGLKLSLHTAEVPDVEDAKVLLDMLPDRIGHGTCLLPQTGGSQELTDIVTHRNIPLELCLTSNVKCGAVHSYNDHHMYYWYNQNHPFTVATDDKGVFSTTLSQEYQIMMKTLDLSPSQVWSISYNAIDHVFADRFVQERLRDIWKNEELIKGF